MKFIQSFDRFLENTVNLNQTRVDAVTSGIETVKNFLKNNELFGKKFKSVSPQGSYRQKTIIKPASDKKEFDVDLLFEMEEVKEWEPKDYLNKLHGEFKKTDRYKDIVDRRGKSRCVTLDYENDFHIDIVPCILKHGVHKIMNKNENKFEDTDADGYAQWFSRKNAVTEKNHLVKVIRLVKYLRDTKQTFTVKSVLLTTLLGNQVYDTDAVDTHYPDVPTALKTLLNRLDAYLQVNPSMPTIVNPSLPGEDFNRHWDQDKYSNFRDKIHDYTTKVTEAYDSQDEEESLEKWRAVFGDDFPEPETTKISESALINIDSLARMYPSPREQFIEDFGIVYRPRGYQFKINVRVEQNGFRPSLLRNVRFLQKWLRLTYFVEATNINVPYTIKWKVRNTGDEALRRNDLRGEIIDDYGYRTKRENTRYTGLHYVECYAIDENNVCIAKDRIEIQIP